MNIYANDIALDIAINEAANWNINDAKHFSHYIADAATDRGFDIWAELGDDMPAWAQYINATYELMLENGSTE